jgi:hypothetical protein
VLLARTASMDELEATAVGDGNEAVTPAALLAAVETRCGVLLSEVCIEVALLTTAVGRRLTRRLLYWPPSRCVAACCCRSFSSGHVVYGLWLVNIVQFV